jgi:AcrR family transcriptional regulator
MTRARPARRRPLTRERVLAAALTLADEHGIEAVSMRRLGTALGVEAMSLYKHVEDKEAILDGIADLVMAEVTPPDPTLPWREAIRRSAVSTHAALLRHPWAAVVFESRVHPGPARLRHLDAVVGILRAAGFPLPDVIRSLVLLDALVYGHALQLSSMPFDPWARPDLTESAVRRFETVGYENLVALGDLALTGPHDLPMDLDFGLDMVLDGLERYLATRRPLDADDRPARR